MVGHFLGLTIGLAVTVLLFATHTTHDEYIKSGKEFIIENASYRCEKTNQLKEE